MEVKRLGNSGLKVSEMVLGTMPFGDQVDEETSIAILDQAFEAGIFAFDSADFYPFPGRPGTLGNSERILGQWAKRKSIRHQVVLATKGPGWTGPSPNERGASRKHIMKAVEESLHRLGGDYIDLYQFGNDPETPLEETLRAMDDLVRQGKVLYVGCNASEAWWVTKALWKSDVEHLESLQSVQLRYNLIDREADDELLPLCLDQGLGVICFSPLAGGMLTGKYLNADEPPPNTRAALLPRFRRLFNEGTATLVREVVKLAEARGVTPSQFALAWFRHNQAVTAPIIGVTSLQHLEETLGAVDLTLSSEELDRCDELWEQLKGYDPKADRRRPRLPHGGRVGEGQAGELPRCHRGRNIALVFAEADADVAVTALTEANARNVAREVGELGRQGLGLVGDATRLDDTERLAAEVLGEFGQGASTLS